MPEARHRRRLSMKTYVPSIHGWTLGSVQIIRIAIDHRTPLLSNADADTIEVVLLVRLNCITLGINVDAVLGDAELLDE